MVAEETAERSAKMISSGRLRLMQKTRNDQNPIGAGVFGAQNNRQGVVGRPVALATPTSEAARTARNGTEGTR
jgi:hypothetical protein